MICPSDLRTELQRDTVRTATLAVEVAVMLSKLNPVDRRTVAELQRDDWTREADLPSVDVLLALAEQIPGAER